MSLATWNNKKREQTIIMEMGREGTMSRGGGWERIAGRIADDSIYTQRAL